MLNITTKMFLMLLIYLCFQSTLTAKEMASHEGNQTTIKCKQKVSSTTVSKNRDDVYWSKELIAGIVGLIAIIVNIVINSIILYNQKKKESIDMLQKQLHEFYAPMESYLHVSYELSKVFKTTHINPDNEESVPYLDDTGNFRTLPYLLDHNKNTLPLSEKTLMEEIITIGKSIEKLIIKQSGLVVDSNLHNTDENEVLNLLTKALVHIRIIRMVYNGKLEKAQIGNDIDNYVFPTNLTDKIQEGKIVLQKKLKIKLPDS